MHINIIRLRTFFTVDSSVSALQDKAGAEALQKLVKGLLERLNDHGSVFDCISMWCPLPKLFNVVVRMVCFVELFCCSISLGVNRGRAGGREEDGS